MIESRRRGRLRATAFYCFFVACLLALSSTAQATIVHVLNLPATPVAPANRMKVTVSYVNTGQQTEILKRTSALHAQLGGQENAYPVRLVLAPRQPRPPAHLHPGEVYQAIYLTEIPDQIAAGIFSLTLDESPAQPAYFVVGNSATVPCQTCSAAIADADAAPTTPADATASAKAAEASAVNDTGNGDADEEDDSGTALVEVVSTAESVDEEAQRNVFLGNFYTYEPMYFLFGTNSTNAKFQISFKYRFVDDESEFAQRHPWLSNLYVAYTQTSFWDLASESAPFRDTNFKPEAFYQFNDVRVPFIGDNAYFDFRAGYQHESNGQSGDISRSLNIAYLEPAFHWNIFGDYQLSVAPRVWTYVGGKDGNEDIRDFRGRSSLTATFTQAEGFQAEALLRGRPGTGNGSLQLDLSYPISALSFFNLDFYLYGQFFTGYGESLLDFNRKDTRFRLGLGLAR